MNIMDKEWVHLSRTTKEYMDAAWKFVKTAQNNVGNPDKILCPCKHCRNLTHLDIETVYEHLVIKGMDLTYTSWFHHGEQEIIVDKTERKEISDAYNLYEATYMHDVEFNTPLEDRNDEDFTKLLDDAETPLYPNCTKYTKLSSIVAFYKLKATYGWSDKSFNSLLELLHDMLPMENVIPKSVYLVRKFLKSFDLGYEKIHACVNDCCLFRKETEKLDKCPKCKFSRWMVDERSKKIKKGVPAKVLRYFPIIPRLRRMFKSSKMAEDLRWHFTHKSEDAKMHHPVDSLAWELINDKWPSFATDPRNLRLGLATDGFNPFSNLSSKYSCWPVMLVTYNLPPWLCMKKENILLTLLIPGPKQPGNDIDVYLEPLIEDLDELWNKGVDAFDAFSKTIFNLKAILMWTVNDFPAYGNLAGCTTKGKTACPICAEKTDSKWLRFSRKFAYMGHRRFLSPSHPYRKKKSWFNGKEEKGQSPRIMTGTNISLALKDFENEWGKLKKRKRKEDDHTLQIWKKRSIFFDLPYWKVLTLRHNLDVMHIEKNVCESILGTLLDINGKTKDGINARKDLEDMGIRQELHPQDRGAKTYLPPAPHTLSKVEKVLFCKRLFNLKVPDGYSSNIGRCVSMEELKIAGLKSHDCHILMQQLLPVALRGMLPKGPRNAIFRLCSFFNKICQRIVDRDKIKALEDEVVETLCMFERFFPPSFFDIMIHLPIHLGRETRLAGPIQFRWMYPFERYMKVLKGYVKNRARPEGCIAECYLADECMTFCSVYMSQFAKLNHQECRNQDFFNDIILEGRPISAGTSITLSDEMLENAHRYVLFNAALVEPYLEMHLEELKQSNKSLEKNKNLLWKQHSEKFSTWLKKKIRFDNCTSNELDTLKWFAYGPRNHAMSYSGYIINGYRFHTKEVQKSTQNSGVSVEATTICRASAKDNSQVVDVVAYYGVIKDIILLDYHKFQLPIFNCDWANLGHGVRVEDGFTLVNLHQSQNHYSREPFILASQAKQVFYSKENESSNWYVLLKAPPRGYYELEMYNENEDNSPLAQNTSLLHTNNDDDNEEVSYVRRDCEGILL